MSAAALETGGLPWVWDDGGRAAAGRAGPARDCVARAAAIVTGRPYLEVCAEINALGQAERASKNRRHKSGARTGVHKPTTRRYMTSLGWTWTPAMAIGQGCTVHLAPGELPAGRLMVSVSKHWTAVIDGVIRDTYDPGRGGRRCVYGWFRQETGQEG
jgi:hypothetical protein